MLRQARSKTASPDERNPQFTELERKPDEGNLQWGLRAVTEISSAGPEAWSYLALLGGSDTLSFRLRIAQSQARADMLPSYWSDSIFIELAGASLDGAAAVHVPLTQPGTPSFPPRQNGVVRRPLSDFDDAVRYPNIALIALPVPQAKILERIDQFRHSRSTLDALEHLLRWLSFAWGVARTGNPLNENYGLPSACMLEIAFAAENFDLTPGLESRAACPEAIWSTARVWHDYFVQTDTKVPMGRYWHPHAYSIVEPNGNQAPPPAAKARKRGGRR